MVKDIFGHSVYFRLQGKQRQRRHCLESLGANSSLLTQNRSQRKSYINFIQNFSLNILFTIVMMQSCLRIKYHMTFFLGQMLWQSCYSTETLISGDPYQDITTFTRLLQEYIEVCSFFLRHFLNSGIPLGKRGIRRRIYSHQ